MCWWLPMVIHCAPTGVPHVYAFNEQAQIIDKCVLSANNQSQDKEKQT